MHLVDSILFVTLVTPLALAGPRGNSFFRRAGDDDTDKDSTLTLSQTSIETFSMTSSPILVSVDQTSLAPLKDQSSTITISSTSYKDKDAPPSTTSTSDKDKATSTTSALDKDTPTSGTSTSDKDDKVTSSASAKDQNTSSSVPPMSFSSTTSMTLPYEASQSSAPESTQEIVVTDVVYTTLTTCPITNTVTSGSSEIEKVTTTISTLTPTSTSTLCTKCVAPPKSKPETPLTSAGATKTSSFPASVIYTLTEFSSHLPSQTPASTETKIPNSSGPPLILYSFTLPKAPLTTAPAKSMSSQPEITFLGTAVSSSTGLIIPSLVSLNVSATSITGPLVISGYSIVPPPTSIPEGPGPLSNASSTIIPVFSAPLLGNAYGGGFVATPSVYATKLASPNGPPEGYAPGYGFSSKPETSATINEILNSSMFNIPGPVETSLPSVSASAAKETSATLSGIVNNSGFNVPGPVETSPSGGPSSVFIPGLSTMPAIGVPVNVSVGSSTPALANAPTSEAATIISSALTTGTPVSIASATPLTEGQFSAAATFSSTVLTPVVGVNGLTSLAVIQPPTVLASLAVGSPTANPSNSLIPSVNGPAPIFGASGLSSIVVVPSPIVGQNGLTSLAVFSTHIAAANGLTSPAVVLTPVVGANGLTSLAVLATPVVGANGLTSLAIGLASEQATATTLPNGVPSPSSEYALIGPAAAASGSQVGIAASPLKPLPVPSKVLLGSSNFTSNGSGGNASVHVSLNPTPIAEFEGSARRMTLSCGAGLVGFIIFLFLL